MAKKASKAAVATVPPAATTFKELAAAFESISQPTSEKMIQLEQQAWALLQVAAAQVDWSDYRLSPLFISGPFANWWAFVEDVGRTGNVKAAFPEVVKASRTTDASEWQSRILADGAVCRWIDEIALDQSPDTTLKRLIQLATHFSERDSWQQIVDLREDLEKREGLSLAWARAELTQIQCNLEMMRNGLSRLYPLLQKHVPAVDVSHMSVPTEAEIVAYCERCQQLKCDLLVAKRGTAPKSKLLTNSSRERSKPFTDAQLEAVRNAIMGSPKITHKGIKDKLTKGGGTAVGSDKLQKILDHIRDHFPGEYTIEKRPRRRSPQSS